MENAFAFWALTAFKFCLILLDKLLSTVFNFTIEFGPNSQKEKFYDSYDVGAQVVKVTWRAVAHNILTITPDNFLYFHER